MVKEDAIYEQLADIRERLSSIETLIKERDAKYNTNIVMVSTFVAGLITAIAEFIVRPQGLH